MVFTAKNKDYFIRLNTSTFPYFREVSENDVLPVYTSFEQLRSDYAEVESFIHQNSSATNEEKEIALQQLNEVLPCISEIDSIRELLPYNTFLEIE